MAGLIEIIIEMTRAVKNQFHPLTFVLRLKTCKLIFVLSEKWFVTGRLFHRLFAVIIGHDFINKHFRVKNFISLQIKQNYTPNFSKFQEKSAKMNQISALFLKRLIFNNPEQ